MKSKLALLISVQVLALVCVNAQTAQSLDGKIATIINRPEFQHALFGIEVYSLTDGKVLYALNENKLFVPGSVTKLVTEGVTMELLGDDYRFRTSIYRTGPISIGPPSSASIAIAPPTAISIPGTRNSQRGLNSNKKRR